MNGQMKRAIPVRCVANNRAVGREQIGVELDQLKDLIHQFKKSQ